MSGTASGSGKFVLLLVFVLSAAIGAEPQMSFRKDSDRLRPKPFETVSYVLSYSNAGDQNATNVTVTDFLPSNTVLSADSAESGNVPHAGTVTVEYWALGSWRESSYDNTNALCAAVEKVRWALDRAVKPGEAGRLFFKVVVR